MSKFLNAMAALALMTTPALADGYGLGREALPEEIAAWNLEIGPDGDGLPEGSGDVLVGEELFAEQCASCHGDFAEGLDNWPKLAGGMDTLDREDPLKTVGSYWPHLTTAYDYIRRSMPYGNAGTLSDDDVYAMLAYIMYSNNLVEDDFVLDRDSLLAFTLPNADGFIVDDRAETEYAIWSGEPCMENCKENVEVTMRARVLDVTPDQDTASEATQASAETGETAAEEAVAEAEEIVTEEAPTAIDAELAAAGEKVFKKCKSCHQVGDKAKNRTGPILNGIINAPAGAVDGFKYSKALMAAADGGLVWSEAELAAFLAKPKQYLKGTRMSFNGLKKEADQAAVIEYLKSYSE